MAVMWLGLHRARRKTRAAVAATSASSPRFTFRLHEVGPVIAGGLAAWSADRVDDVLATYRELTAAAPRELTAVAIVRLAPPAPFVPDEWHLKPVVGLLVCHSGTSTEADLAPLRALGEPVFNLIGATPYAAQQSMLDAMEPKGLNQYWKAEFLRGLPGEDLPTFRDAALDVASPLSFSVIFHLAGALIETDDGGAVGNREARFSAATPECGRRRPTDTASWARFARDGADPAVLDRRELRQLSTGRGRRQQNRRRIPGHLRVNRPGFGRDLRSW